MKHKILLGLTLSFLNLFVNAQETIAIPDVAFEEALIDLKIDTNGLNGNILVSDASYAVNLNIFDPINNKELPNVHSKIKDLTGIEHFPNLKKLVCYGNEISKIDLTQNKELTFVNCSDNKIVELDLTNSKKLRFLSCDTNNISVLKLGQKPDLSELYCNVNKLSSLDLSDCSGLRSADISGNNLENVSISTSVVSLLEEGWFKDDKTNYTSKSGDVLKPSSAKDGVAFTN